MGYPDDASRSASLYRRGQRVMPGGNSRHSVILAPYPLYADHGAGCRVTDVEGVERIDFINNWSSLIHGHRHPVVMAAIDAQLSKIMAVGMPTAVEIELAECLVERVPGIEKLRFSNSGSEGVLMAIRAARAFTGRTRIAKVEGAYHGNPDVVEVSVAPHARDYGSAHAPRSVAATGGIPPSVLEETLVLPFNDPQSSEALIREHGDELAAVVVDPVVSRMGFIEATPEYLGMLRSLTTELDILLIYDEVFSFRLGYHGIQGEVGVIPDLTALGKIIGGGLPVGATGGRADVMAVFDQTERPLRVEHGGTYNGNPLTMAAGLAGMELLTPAAFSRLEMLGDRLRDGLRGILDELGVPGQVTGRGSLCSLALFDHPLRNYRDVVPDDKARRAMAGLHCYLLNHGVQIAPSGMFILSTVMTEAEIDYALEQVRNGLVVEPSLATHFQAGTLP